MSARISERTRLRSKFRDSVGSEEFLQMSRFVSTTLPFLMTLQRISRPVLKWFLLRLFYRSELVTYRALIIAS